SSFRSPQLLFWMIAYPLIMVLLLNGIFSGIASSATISSQKIVAVQNSSWKNSLSATKFVDSLNKKKNFVEINYVATVDEAVKKIDNNKAAAYIEVNNDGKMSIGITDTVAQQMANDSQRSSKYWTLTTLRSVINQYNQNVGIITNTIKNLMENNPSKLADTKYMEKLMGVSSIDYTSTVNMLRVKKNPDLARYMFVLIGMMAVLGMTIVLGTYANVQPDASTYGARVTMSPLTRSQKVFTVILSSWIVSMVTLFIVYLFIRYVVDIDMAGRDAFVLLALAIAALLAQSLGLLISIIPKLSSGAKVGLSVGFTMICSFFAGLQGSMSISDWIDNNMPIFSLINPVKQAGQMFTDLLVYDNVTPFMHTAFVCIIMSVICTGISLIIMRSDRYEHI
ncbi:MAG: ABC transporter permease, partial [Bifidobacteriaceae bacterium]|nr:ABC transporter permease [Bifidobacteriaceae bacterium]